jgi:hypothetical protein
MGLAMSVLWAPVAAAEEVPDLPGAISVWQVPDRAGPAHITHHDAARYARQHPGSVPPGVNDFTCTPTAVHPRPVVLVDGTDSNAYSDWAALGPRLAAAGYCVFALNYGGEPGGDNYGTEDMTVSAGQLAQFVATVRDATAAPEVDLAGKCEQIRIRSGSVGGLGADSCAVRLHCGVDGDPLGRDVLRRSGEPGRLVCACQEQVCVPSSHTDCGVDESAVEEQVAEEVSAAGAVATEQSSQEQ